MPTENGFLECRAVGASTIVLCDSVVVAEQSGLFRVHHFGYFAFSRKK